MPVRLINKPAYSGLPLASAYPPVPPIPWRTRKSRDGSITLYIQKDSPLANRKSNWLPAADGPIYLVMRLYWPRAQPPSILPPGECRWNPPPVVRASGSAPP
ncbi:MAG: DUF1214 domain-containing protein [Thermoguttaceae bacterium]|nr:DUF1214 domain-containing protein [Thermoguttaceae bacterium]